MKDLRGLAAQECYVANGANSDNVLQHRYIGRRAWNRRASRQQQRRIREQVEDRSRNGVAASSPRIYCLTNEVGHETWSSSDAVDC